LRGHVVFPDGKPVPGAEVVIQSGPSPMPGSPAEAADGARKTLAGADGGFAFENLRVGTYLLSALHDDDVAPTSAVELLPNTADVTLVVFPGAALEVHVRAAADRAPIAGATVRITDGDRSFGEQWSFRTSQADAQGVAKFRGIAATANHLIVASAPGYVETELAIHNYDFSDRTWSVELALPKAARVSGRVVDSNGRGIAHATVGWELDGVARPENTPDLFDPFAFHGHIQATQTDEQGRFVLDAAPGRGCVLAAHPTHQLGEVCEVTVSLGSERSGIEIVLRDGGQVSGSVVWSDGTAAAGATVIATKRDWIHQPMQSKSYRFEARTGPDGRFEFRGIKRGAFELTAFTDDASSGLVAVDLTKSAVARNIELKLEHEGAIRGRVVDQAKNPIGYALVDYFIDPTLAPPDAQGKPRPQRRFSTSAQPPEFALPRSIGATRADGDGNFEIRGLPPGLYDIRATRPQQIDLPPAYSSTTEEGIAPGETVEIVLPGLGGVKGRVIADTGRPVTTFGVSLARTSGQPKRDQFAVAKRIVSSDGTFMLGAVPGGVYRLRIDGEDVTEQLAAEAITIASGKIADAGTIQVSRGVRRHGVVLAKDRKPVAGARVTAMVEGMADPFIVESQDDGSFALPPLPADRPLRIRADQMIATSDWVAVAPATTKIELVLAKEGAGTVTGVLVEPNAPLDRRSIVLTLVGEGTPDDKLPAVRNALTQEGGTFTLDSVRAGEYLVWVRRSSRLKQTEGDLWWKQATPIRVEPQRETHVLLAVPAGAPTDVPQGGSGQGRGGGKP
jgi:protocatechuate 3,4-dioxygenase beta subunit